MAGGRQHIHQIDALRGLAACAVAFVFHAGTAIGRERGGPLEDLPLFSWLHAYGYTAVDLFFVISGFIFAHTYLDGTRLRTGVSFGSFMKARIARLYPLHIATLLLVALIVAISGVQSFVNSDPRHFLLNLFFLQESGLNAGYSFNVPAWSLSVEMLCYILFILAALAGPRVLGWSALAFILGGIALTTLGDKSLLNIGRGLTGYFTGYFLWRYRAELSARLSVASAILAVSALLAGPFIPLNYGIVLSLTAWPILVLAVPRSKLLEAAPMRWIGERSYSIYLIHCPVYFFFYLILFDRREAPPSLWTAATLAAVAITLLLADLSYRYFEAPARLYIRSLTFGRRPTRIPA